MLAVPLVALVALRLSAVTFGGIGGDVVGATGEACRAVMLVAGSPFRDYVAPRYEPRR